MSIYPPDDEMGFATPVAPAHSLQLLNSYMRTDILRHLHESIQKKMDDGTASSPLQHIADGLTEVIDVYEDTGLFECVERNPFHLDPGYPFSPEKDYAHDIKLMKHHLKAHKKTLRELSKDW